MLHSNSDLYNQTELLRNFNYSSVNITHSFNLYNNFKYSTREDKNSIKCCPNIDKVITNSGISLSNKKVEVIMNEVNGLDTKKNRKRRVVNVIRTNQEATTSENPIYMEGTTVSELLSSPPLVMERRRKPGETGSSAPLLNYIFDTIHSSNTHQHRNEK